MLLTLNCKHSDWTGHPCNKFELNKSGWVADIQIKIMQKNIEEMLVWDKSDAIELDAIELCLNRT